MSVEHNPSDPFRDKFGNVVGGNSETHWQRDRYSDRPESQNRYYQVRHSNNFDPVEHERIDTYLQRFAKFIKEYESINIESHIYGRKIWYTHKNPSGCWMCDSITILWLLFDHLDNMSKTLVTQKKTLEWFNKQWRIIKV